MCVCVFWGTPLCLPVRKVDGCLCVFLVYVCFGTTYVSVSGQFQVLMALLQTQCECCVVSVTVCVCVLGNTTVSACLKSRWMFVNVSCVCVCRAHICVYIRVVPSHSEYCVVSVIVYVCVYVFVVNRCV